MTEVFHVKGALPNEVPARSSCDLSDFVFVRREGTCVQVFEYWRSPVGDFLHGKNVLFQYQGLPKSCFDDGVSTSFGWLGRQFGDFICSAIVISRDMLEGGFNSRAFDDFLRLFRRIGP